MKQYDVTAFGELLVDFTESGLSAQGNPLLEANPGGAPCNVLSMLARLGHQTAFIGRVGRDHLGDMLVDTARKLGIDTTGISRDRSVHTTLAFVHTQPDGDRVFSFCRNPGADMMLTEEDVDENLLNCRIFHFGSLSMTAPACFAATDKAIRIARENGALISFDPNLREPLWPDLTLARQRIAYGLQQCDVLKIADNELVWLTGESDLPAAARQLKAQYGISLVLLTLGRNGSMAFADHAEASHSGYAVDTIETTGAGDTFFGCALHHILAMDSLDLTAEELHALLSFANAAAALITTRKGAMKAMPDPVEIAELRRNSHGISLR